MTRLYLTHLAILNMLMILFRFGQRQSEPGFFELTGNVSAAQCFQKVWSSGEQC